MQEADERPVIPLEDDMSEQGSCVQKKKVTKKPWFRFHFIYLLLLDGQPFDLVR